jgi:flagellar biosynthesis protein FlhF
MQIKRIVAGDVRSALAQVRAALGAEAVILSNRTVPEGVEIVAAMDFDAGQFAARNHGAGTMARSADSPAAPVAAVSAATDAPAPVLDEMRRELVSLRGFIERELAGLASTEEERRDPTRARLTESLVALGLPVALARTIARGTRIESDADTNLRNALAVLAHRLPVADDSLFDRGSVLALVGPSGVGKTTTIAKLAARCVMRHGARSCALITTDTDRIGATEQIRTYGRILGIPVMTAPDVHALRSALDGLKDRRLVLVDTAGIGQRDARLVEQVELLSPLPDVTRLLVLAATTQAHALGETVRAYRALAPAACIVTKLDEAGSLGGLIGTAIEYELPLAWVSAGHRVPEDLNPARAHQLVAQAARCVALATADYPVKESGGRARA